MYKYIYSQFFQYTIRWDKTQMLKKFPLYKINGTKNALFLSINSSVLLSIHNSWKSWNAKVHLSKTVCRIFNFWIHLVFVKVYIIVQQKARNLWFWNVITPFQIRIIEKPQTVLLPGLWTLSYNKKLKSEVFTASLFLNRNF